MEWNVLFFQSLLILLVASHVTYVCSCSMITWGDALCPGRKKTVVRATAISVKRLAYQENVLGAENFATSAKYQMRLESTLANGSVPLNVTDGMFRMMFPLVSSVWL